MLVIALGVTAEGTKRFLGFVETDTENDKVLAPFLRSLVERGLNFSQGLLVVIDGGKGLRSAVRAVFQKKALVQRCMWHKRENVLSYLPKSKQVEERCAKVDAWKNSKQRQRWLATALLDIEPRLRRVKGYRQLPQLVSALGRALNIKQQNRMQKAA